MSYKLSLKIKQEFIATNERHEKEAKDRRDADSDYDTDDENEYLQTSVGNNIINDPAKLNLHTKASHHRGALSEDLHDAAWREDITLMKELIEKDPSLLEETDTGGQNLLHLSAFWGSLLVTEQLIKFGIDTDAVNIHAQRPLDIALQWGHVNVADVIRNAGGTSLFEDKILSVERHLMLLEDELTIARNELLKERTKRKISDSKLKTARRVARLAHDEWKKELMDKMLARGSSQFLERSLHTSNKKNIQLTENYHRAVVWGSYESNWRKKLQAELILERQRIQERNRCIRMGSEEIRASKVERSIATEIRDHALAEASASKEARVVAETICKEAIKYMEKLRPYKTKYNQLLRRNGINGVTSSLSDLLRVVPNEVLAGAVKVLSDLSRVTSTAQPGNLPKTILSKEEFAAKNKSNENKLTLKDLQQVQTRRKESDLEENDSQDKHTARSIASTSNSVSSSISSLHSSASFSSKKKKRKKRSKKFKTNKESNLLFDRMSKKGLREDSNSQVANDLRRSKGEVNRMGGLPSTPFDLLVLDPYGVGLEVLQCVHMSKDYEGYDRLRVTSRAPVDPTTDYFNRVDERRKMDYDAKIAVKRAKNQHRRTANKIKSLNRIKDGNSGRSAWNSRPNTVEGEIRKTEPVIGGIPRRKQMYEVEKLWSAAFAPNKNRVVKTAGHNSSEEIRQRRRRRRRRKEGGGGKSGTSGTSGLGGKSGGSGSGTTEGEDHVGEKMMKSTSYIGELDSSGRHTAPLLASQSAGLLTPPLPRVHGAARLMSDVLLQSA